MKEIVILSGKGGTGKTSITAAFASLAGRMVLCDCDVDAADLHLLMAPRNIEQHEFQGGNVAIIDPERCTCCGQCRELCRFDAVIVDKEGNYLIDGIGCEGCGVCVDLCPAGAIDFPMKTCGEWFIADTRLGTMVHARLGIAEENSGKLVTLIRKEAARLAGEQGIDFLLTDGPPGIGCPVIASLGGASVVVIVSEPTVSGLHDLERVARLTAHFKVPAMVCVNKADLNLEQAEAIRALAADRGMLFLGALPFDPAFTTAMIAGRNILEHAPGSEAAGVLRAIWQRIVEALDNK